jgi:hypothetical protein
VLNGKLVMNELARIWSEAVMNYFKGLSQYFAGESEENYENHESGEPVSWLRIELSTS